MGEGPPAGLTGESHRGGAGETGSEEGRRSGGRESMGGVGKGHPGTSLQCLPIFHYTAFGA